MKRALIFVALAVMAFTPTPAAAAPAAPAVQCTESATTQFDMAGTYRSADQTLLVKIFPCGGIYVEWTNRSGTHAGAYATEVHASDGVVATLASGEALDGQPHLAVKAAERGFVQIGTIDAALKVVQIYRLRKVS